MKIIFLIIEKNIIHNPLSLQTINKISNNITEKLKKIKDNKLFMSCERNFHEGNSIKISKSFASLNGLKNNQKVLVTCISIEVIYFK